MTPQKVRQAIQLGFLKVFHKFHKMSPVRW